MTFPNYYTTPNNSSVSTEGVVGDLIAKLAPIAGQTIGNSFGQGQIGSAAGALAGQLASMIPFSAAPGTMQAVPSPAPVSTNDLARLGAMMMLSMTPNAAATSAQPAAPTPQGVFGDLISQLAPSVGSAVGGLFGQGQIGSAIGQVAGQVGKALPFGIDRNTVMATAQSQPFQQQGVFGDLLSQLAPVAGSAIGGAFGQQQIGSTAGQLAGHIASLLPFAAGPTGSVAQAQAMTPQGIDVGSILNTVGSIASSVAPLLPLILLSGGPTR